jgi:xanthine dehydrogenase accessory factor
MDINQKIYELSRTNKPFVVATVTGAKGSVPGKVGFKIIVEADRTIGGTVGGGAIEEKAKDDALDALSSGISVTKNYLLSDKVEEKDNDVTVVPMKCQGKVTIFYEVYNSLPTVYVFGGGHVGQALLKILNDLNYYSILIDNRKEFADKSINKFASKIIHSDYIEYSNNFSPADDSFIVILTHGHSFDYKILHALYKRKIEVRYIGAIASANKARELKSKLVKELGNSVDVDNIHAPIGLNIGGTTAAEIAVSICAEMQSIRYHSEKD